MKRLGFVFAAACLAAAGPALAADVSLLIPETLVEMAAGGHGVTFNIGFGVEAFSAEEIVYLGAGDDRLLSYLIWTGVAPVLTTSLDVDLPNNWTLAIDAAAGTGGDSHMVDYDWIKPLSYNFDDWSNRSIHPDTRLHFLAQGSAFLGYNITTREHTTFNLHAGLDFKALSWTTYGGTFIYSTVAGSPRDNIGIFADKAGISLLQRWPAALVGASVAYETEKWNANLTVRGGMTFLASDTDVHWARKLRFEDTLRPAPIVTVAAGAAYAVSDNLKIFVKGQYENRLRARGDTAIFDLPTGADRGTFGDFAGASLQTGRLSIGLTGGF